MQEVGTKVAAHETCMKRWASKYPWVDDSGHICLDPDGTAKSCKGDSGGPMMCQEKGSFGPDAPWYVVGISSWGATGCNKQEDPTSLYTNAQLKQYVDWIRAECGNCA